jgi:cytochrome c oxidase subunit IV
MATLEETNVQVQPKDKQKILKLWKIAGILFVITAIEFVFAFTMNAGPLRTSIFICLTIVKAFYIVAEFMHLRGEVKALIFSIIIPLIFVIWLIIALLFEGSAIFQLKY